MQWLNDMGALDQKTHEVESLSASRDQPSMQLVGSPTHRTLDIPTLLAAGVSLVGRAMGVRGSKVFFADDLVETLAAADFKLASLRLRIDRHIARTSADIGQLAPPDEFRPTPLPWSPDVLDLKASGIRTVLWATGFTRSYPWLHVPVLDSLGEIRHVGGITPASGLYALGLNFMRRRSSSFLTGVGRDAEELADHIVASRTGVRPMRSVA